MDGLRVPPPFVFPGAPVHSGTTAWLHDAGFGGWGTIFARHIAFCGWPSCGMLGLCRVAAAGDSTSTPAAHSSTQELHGRIGVRHSRMFARAHTHTHTRTCPYVHPRMLARAGPKWALPATKQTTRSSHPLLAPRSATSHCSSRLRATRQSPVPLWPLL